MNLPILAAALLLMRRNTRPLDPNKHTLLKAGSRVRMTFQFPPAPKLGKPVVTMIKGQAGVHSVEYVAPLPTRNFQFLIVEQTLQRDFLYTHGQLVLGPAPLGGRLTELQIKSRP